MQHLDDAVGYEDNSILADGKAALAGIADSMNIRFRPCLCNRRHHLAVAGALSCIASRWASCGLVNPDRSVSRMRTTMAGHEAAQSDGSQRVLLCDR